MGSIRGLLISGYAHSANKGGVKPQSIPSGVYTHAQTHTLSLSLSHPHTRTLTLSRLLELVFSSLPDAFVVVSLSLIPSLSLSLSLSYPLSLSSTPRMHYTWEMRVLYLAWDSGTLALRWSLLSVCETERVWECVCACACQWGMQCTCQWCILLEWLPSLDHLKYFSFEFFSVFQTKYRLWRKQDGDKFEATRSSPSSQNNSKKRNQELNRNRNKMEIETR